MRLVKSILLIFLFTSVCATAIPAWADPADADGSREKETSTWGSPIGMFQKFVSRADGNRCPMYPSCSHYSAQAFREKGLLKGWILTCDRLLRCGRDETRLAPKVRIQGEPHAYDTLEANVFWWDKR